MSTSDPKSGPGKKSSPTCKLVGLVIFAAAVASVFLIDWTKEIGEEPMVVRPIKTMVIGEPVATRGRPYPGKVGAGRQVNLSFEVPGTILELDQLVRKGDEVEEGELLMRLDDRDYRDQYKAAVAERDRARDQYQRLKRAAGTGAVSDQEVENAEAALEQAEANLNIKQKALEETELRATFKGMVGDIFVKQFQAVQAKQAVLSLIDLATIEIDISVPEADAARAKRENRDKIGLEAIFDFYPGEEFEATFKEVATEADPATQTYTVTVELPCPPGKNVLPGMTATVMVYPPKEVLGEDAEEFDVPLDAVAIDGLGQYYVWKLRNAGAGTYSVHRCDVQVGDIVGKDKIVVREGLAKNDRIALAGVYVLSEGRPVRLLDSEAEAGKPGEEDEAVESE